MRPEYLRALRPLEKTLGKCCSSFYFEWHLADPRRTDLLYSVVREKGPSLTKSIAADPGMCADPRWRVLQRFLDNWDTVNDRLDGILPHIWLASDFDSATKRFVAPNVHFCLDPNFTRRDDIPDYRNILTERRFSKAIRAIADISLNSLSEPVARSMLKCFRALDAHDGEVVHLSFMHGRTPPVFKLNCTLPSSALASVLKSAGRRVDPAPVIDIVNEFAPTEKRIKCNLRIDAGVCDRFELELEYNTPLKSDPRRKSAFESLFRRGLAAREQLRYLRKWPGSVQVPLGPRKIGTSFERWLDIKLVIDDQAQTTAKAYLGFSPLPVLDW